MTSYANAHSIGCCICLLSMLSLPVAAQDSAETTETSLPGDVGVTFSKPTQSFWEFGVKITANGSASGITATAPLPIGWPEQEFKIIEEVKSNSVARISIKPLTKDSQQMLCKINRLKPGEVAEAFVRVRITKSHIVAPADPSKLRFAKKLSSRLRKYLRPSPFIESSHSRIKAIAKSLKTDEELSDWQQAEAIYRWVRENVEYKFDTQIHSCLDALDSGHGDCEELSSLFIALCRASGIPARAVWIPGHTYPEFYMTDGDGNDHWIPCQAAGSYQFGAMTESRPILQKGDRFKLPGNPKPMRYIQPTLVAKDASAGLKFEWISREAEGSSSRQTTGRDR